jgi:hypothetical protein
LLRSIQAAKPYVRRFLVLAVAALVPLLIGQTAIGQTVAAQGAIAQETGHDVAAPHAPALEPPPEEAIPEELPAPETIVVNPVTGCIQPAPMVRIQDYNGPMAKIVGTFASGLERTSVHTPYIPGVKLCSLTVREKFKLFLHSSVDPLTLLSVGFFSGLSQATNGDPHFGQGGAGFAKRLGAEYTDQATWRFFNNFLYPSIFKEDPRYYRQARGTVRSRLFHAMQHTVIAKHDDGRSMINFDEWLSTGSALAIGYKYHPGSSSGLRPAIRDGSILIVQDMGFDILREFWPEISRAFKLPFRDATSNDVEPRRQ